MMAARVPRISNTNSASRKVKPDSFFTSDPFMFLRRIAAKIGWGRTANDLTLRQTGTEPAYPLVFSSFEPFGSHVDVVLGPRILPTPAGRVVAWWAAGFVEGERHYEYEYNHECCYPNKANSFLCTSFHDLLLRTASRVVSGTFTEEIDVKEQQ